SSARPRARDKINPRKPFRIWVTAKPRMTERRTERSPNSSIDPRLMIGPAEASWKENASGGFRESQRFRTSHRRVVFRRFRRLGPCLTRRISATRFRKRAPFAGSNRLEQLLRRERSERSPQAKRDAHRDKS